MSRLRVATGALALALVGGVATAQDNPPDTAKFVSREEYEKLLKQMQEMQTEMAAMKKERAAAPAAAPAASGGQAVATQADIDAAMDDVDKRLKAIQHQADLTKPGKTNIFIGGDAAFGFTSQKHAPNSFDAGLSPLVLWQLSDRVLVEGAVDIGFNTDDQGVTDTKVDLTIANISYMIDPALIVGAGLFVVPFGVFHNHYDPPWINKLPDTPLPYGDSGIAPSSEVGAFLEGAHAIGSTKINYAFYLTNGPQLQTGKDNAGSLNFADYTDTNSNKAVGGRMGFLPVPELEVGYSLMYADVEPDGFYRRVGAWLQAVDISYKKAIEPIDGMIDLRTEWVWSNVDNATYPGTGRFNNDRNAGYVQLSYRPTMVSNKIIRNLEPIVRWDRLAASKNAPGGGSEERWTVGLDYWIMPNLVLKTAYQFDKKQGDDNVDIFMIQVGVGL